MLIVLPLGLFMAAVVFDLLYVWRGTPAFSLVAYWNILVGLLGGLLAAAFGFLDWLAIPAGTRAKRVGLVHGAANFVVLVLFAMCWVLRTASVDHTATYMVFGLEIVALAIGAFAGWLGGELVDRLAVGVDDGAHLNAPSSLSGRPTRPA
jgi:uncharacterized membrane protein